MFGSVYESNPSRRVKQLHIPFSLFKNSKKVSVDTQSVTIITWSGRDKRYLPFRRQRNHYLISNTSFKKIYEL